MKRLTTILLTFFIAYAVFAQTTYYVAPDGSGNNGDAGGVGDPWATLAYAVTQTSTTDTIHMQAGTHTINTTVALPIGISLSGVGASSIITSTDLTAEWDAIIDLVSSGIADGAQHIDSLYFDGNLTTGTEKFMIIDFPSIRKDTIRQFRYDFMNIEIEEKIELYNGPMWEPAYIIMGTFLVNHIIVSNNPNPNPLITGSIFIVGGAWSLHTFLKKSKTRKNRKRN